jgi:signal transduction histidine kinase
MGAAGRRTLLAAPVVAAGLLALAVVAVALVAAGALAERDEAVRRGVLLELGHELEASLREQGPDAGAAALGSFVKEHLADVKGAEVVGPHGVLFHAGEVEASAVEMPLALGRDWRFAVGGPGFGGGAGRGHGMPLRARIQPAAALGSAGTLATVVLAGSVVTAAALVAFAVFGVRGLAQRQALAVAQAEGERLEALALAGAGLAHRVRNPLAAIKGTAQLLAEQGDEGCARRAGRILEAGERIDALLSRLLDFARPPEAHAEEVNLGELAGRVASAVPGSVRVEAAPGIAAWADAEHVQSILEELLANARAFDPEGVLEVEARREGGRGVVEVRDRGPGLGIEAERAFLPYVTGRPAGTGLGLPIVRALARANRGDVTLAPRPGGGCVARLELPARRG